MGIYERLGVRPLINATCHWTDYGGTIMWPEVIEAMADARRSCVSVRELFDRASAVITSYTHADAAHILSGCAAALQVGAAAIMTGNDVVKMAALPQTAGVMKNEFLSRSYARARDDSGRTYPLWGYAHAVRTAGGVLVEVGDQHGVTREQFEAAFGPNTVGVYWMSDGDGVIPGIGLAEVTAIAHQRGVAVLVDASNTLPPAENLYRFIDLGVDLVAFSGGKGLRGPQGSGILTGRADLVRSARLQAPPNDGIGRGLKVSKEEIVGLLTALEVWSKRDHDADLRDAQRRTEYLVQMLAGLDGARVEYRFPDHLGRPYPTVFITLDPSVGLSGESVIKALLDGNPSVAVMGFNDPMIVRIDVRILTDSDTEQVAAAVRRAIDSIRGAADT